MCAPGATEPPMYPTWPEGPQHPPVPVNAVHVWMADISSGEGGTAGMEGLSAEEIQRAREARSIAYRDAFVRTRQTLRALLGRYLQVAPSEIALRTGEHGKLYLAPPFEQKLQFNLSHTAGIALIAFAWERQVGIDVDRLNRIADWQGVAKRSFSEREQIAIEALPESDRGASFMRGWIRKEAYAKARGAGFKYGFSRFSVSTAEHGTGSLLLNDTLDEAACRSWTLREIRVAPPLAAALAIENDAAEISFWRVGR